MGETSTVLIEKIFCGNKFSGLLLNTGEFWACGNCAGAGKPPKKVSGVGGADIPVEEQLLAQMQKDEEIARVLAATQAAANSGSDEEWGGGRNKIKKKGGKQ